MFVSIGGLAGVLYDKKGVATTLHLSAERSADVTYAAEILRRGGLVAFPTETVYGLGANALSREAVAGIFHAKQRPSWDPLIVHVPDAAAVAGIAHMSGELAERMRALAHAFWPGPLTLLLPRTVAVPDEVTAGRPLVGVRVPSHPAALALLREVQLPLAAPSANRFGHTSPTTAAHVLHDLEGRIDAVLDGGPCSVGVESTVLDPAPTPMVIYRAGAVTPAMLQRAIGVEATLYEGFEGDIKQSEPQALPSPGVGIRHYAPEVPVLLTGGSAEGLTAAVSAGRARGLRLGVLLPSGWPIVDDACVVTEPWGRWDDAAALAQHLFAGLRTLEQAPINLILCPLPEPGADREALRDRLSKAAKAK